MENRNKTIGQTQNREDSKVDFKLIPCPCCEFPVSYPENASSSVCVMCPNCGHRECA